MELLGQPEILALLFGAALIAGFVDSLAGGGGLITLPALLLAQIPPVGALATNKLQASFGTLTSSVRMLRSGMVSWRNIRPLFIASLVGSALGTLLVQRVDTSVLDIVIPVVLVVIALYYLLAPNVSEASTPKISERLYKVFVAPCIGFYDGFFGPGTGSLFAFSRNALRGDSLVNSTARAKLMNFASNVTSLALFVFSGHIVWLAGAIMIVGQVLGAYLGSHMIIGGKVHWIRPLLVCVCIAMAIRYLWQTFVA